jgi:isopenicillin N synthase-like dioxygenase
MSIPVIDISDFQNRKNEIAFQLEKACTEFGFFYISNHSISPELINKLKTLSSVFFSLPEQEKAEIAMSKGGHAWRGFFPVNGELTSGKPDRKEGIYFGQELDPSHPKVKSGTPLHGANLFPENPDELQSVVLEYINQVGDLAQTVLKGLALALELEETYFYDLYTQDPLILFRIFHYPPQENNYEQWGVGEHTDYGLLTLLLQDDVGGLQVKTPSGWIDAPPIENTFVCNIGDMLDRITGGYYKSNPHRVMNKTTKSRYSFPVFFDPGFDTKISSIVSHKIAKNTSSERWDNTNIHTFEGTYGQYIMNKVGKVFPDLREKLLS